MTGSGQCKLLRGDTCLFTHTAEGEGGPVVWRILHCVNALSSGGKISDLNEYFHVLNGSRINAQ